MNDAGSVAPSPDKAAMLKTLTAMFEPDDVVELRAFQSGKKRTDAGYFDGEHRQELVNDAARLNAAGAAVYVTLNQIDRQLLLRYCNRIEQFASATVTDANVIRRKWLLLDFDPVRPKDTSATDAQLEAAHQKARECAKYLKAAEWPEPLAGQSGNGWHLLFPLDLPNDTGSRDLVKGALAGLAARFDDAVVTVDQSVFNAGRITKLFGTVANKGDHTPLAPWRTSRLVSIPKRGSVVTPDQLRALHPKAAAQPASSDMGSTFDLSDFLARLNIPYEQDQHEGRERFKLARCPFNINHGKGEAAIFRSADGKLGFKCQHNSCADKRWQDVRALLDGPRDARDPRRTGAEGKGRAEYQTSDGSAPACDSWPDPLPLPATLPPVAAFDFDLLPTSLRPWIQDIAERVQCPPDFPAVGAMISLAAVVGRKIGIRPKRRDDWLEVPNLWGAVVGRPGVMKSPALRESMRPLGRLQAKALEGYDLAITEWRRAQELHKLKREAKRAKIVQAFKGDKYVAPDALADDFADDEPQARRYVVNDATVEALGVILQGNPNGTLAYRDELIGLLKSLDKEGNEGARGFYLSAWNGTDAYTYDRIGRGLNLRIEACCLSLLGSIQPAVIGGYLRQAVADGGGDGLLSRFQLLVWPDIAGEWRDVDRWPETEAKAGAFATFERLDALDPASIGSTIEESVIPYLRFDADAQALFSEWRGDFERRIRSGNEHAAFEAHLAKYRKLVPALALLIHLADNPAGGAIGETALLKALAWAEYLESHARRAYASVTQAEVEGARALLHRIRRGEVANPFVPRDVYLKHWASLSEPGQVHEAVRLLADLDYLRKEEHATGGRPKAVIWINPKVMAA